MTMSLRVELMAPPDGSRASHLCLVLHGLGDDHTGWMPVAPMLSLPGLGFAFADAPLPYGGGWSWFGLGERMDVDLEDLRRSRRLLAELIAQLLARHQLPQQRLFLLGFSQGALMALDAGLRAAEPFAGVVAISGFLAEIEAFPAAFGAGLARERLLMTHGRQDPMIPIQPVRALARRLTGMGAPLTWREYDKPHTLDPGEELADIRRFLAEGMAGAAVPPAPG